MSTDLDLDETAPFGEDAGSHSPEAQTSPHAKPIKSPRQIIKEHTIGGGHVSTGRSSQQIQEKLSQHTTLKYVRQVKQKHEDRSKARLLLTKQIEMDDALTKSYVIEARRIQAELENLYASEQVEFKRAARSDELMRQLNAAITKANQQSQLLESEKQQLINVEHKRDLLHMEIHKYKQMESMMEQSRHQESYEMEVLGYAQHEKKKRAREQRQALMERQRQEAQALREAASEEAKDKEKRAMEARKILKRLRDEKKEEIEDQTGIFSTQLIANQEKKAEAILQLKRAIEDAHNELKAKNQILRKKQEQKEKERAKERQDLLHAGRNPDAVFGARDEAEKIVIQKEKLEKRIAMHQLAIMDKVLKEEEKDKAARLKKVARDAEIGEIERALGRSVLTNARFYVRDVEHAKEVDHTLKNYDLKNPRLQRKQIYDLVRPLKSNMQLELDKQQENTKKSLEEQLNDIMTGHGKRGDAEKRDGAFNVKFGQIKDQDGDVDEDSDDAETFKQDQEDWKQMKDMPDFGPLVKSKEEEEEYQQAQLARIAEFAKSNVNPAQLKMDQQKVIEGLVKQKKTFDEGVPKVVCGKTYDTSKFLSSPPVILFKDFEIMNTYTQKVTLTNVSFTFNTFKLMPIADEYIDFFNIVYVPVGRMSAGQTATFKITFSPKVNEDIITYLPLMAETGPFRIPLHCLTRKAVISVEPKVCDLGAVCCGETLTDHLVIKNEGAVCVPFKVVWLHENRHLLQQDDGGNSVKEKAVLDQEIDGVEMPLAEQGFTEDAGQSASTKRLGGGNSNSNGTSGKSLESTQSSAAAASALTISEEDASWTQYVTYPLTGIADGYSSQKFPVTFSPMKDGRFELKLLLIFGKDEAVKSRRFSVQWGSPTQFLVTVKGVGSKVPIYVENEVINLQACVLDKMYRTIAKVRNRSQAAMKIIVNVPPFLKGHLEMTPDTGFVQARSFLDVQVKFTPHMSLVEKIKKRMLKTELLKKLEQQELDAEEAKNRKEGGGAEDGGAEIEATPRDKAGAEAGGAAGAKAAPPAAAGAKKEDEKKAAAAATASVEESKGTFASTDAPGVSTTDGSTLSFVPSDNSFADEAAHLSEEADGARPTYGVDQQVTITVPDQTLPVHFRVVAQLENGELTFEPPVLDFGSVFLNQTASIPVTITNHSSILQKVAFIPEPTSTSVDVQPGDGYMVILPFRKETRNVMFSPKSAMEYQFSVCFKSKLGGEYRLKCSAFGIPTPLIMSPSVLKMACVSDGDCGYTSLYLTNPTDQIKNVEIALPTDPGFKKYRSFLSVNPRVAAVAPGQTIRVELAFGPRIEALNDEDEAALAILAAEAEAAAAAAADEAEAAAAAAANAAPVDEKKVGKAAAPAKAPAGKKKTPEEEAAEAAEAGKEAERQRKAAEELERQQEKARLGFAIEDAFNREVLLRKKTERSFPPNLLVPESLIEFSTDITTDDHEPWSRHGRHRLTIFVQNEKDAAKQRAARAAQSIKEAKEKEGIKATAAAESAAVDGKALSLETGKGTRPMILSFTVHTTAKRPVLIARPRTVDFGQVALGIQSSKAVEIKNMTTSPLALTMKSMPVNSAFAVLSSLRPLAPLASIFLIVQFRPHLEKTHFDEFVIRTSGGGGGQVRVAVKGQCVAPVVEVDPVSCLLDMGDILVGDCSSKTFTVKNASSFPCSFVFEQIPITMPNSKGKAGMLGEKNSATGLPEFYFVPGEATIGGGQTINITAHFTPDHPSSRYVTGVRIGDHVMTVFGRAHARQVFVLGGEDLAEAKVDASSGTGAGASIPVPADVTSTGAEVGAFQNPVSFLEAPDPELFPALHMVANLAPDTAHFFNVAAQQEVHSNSSATEDGAKGAAGGKTVPKDKGGKDKGKADAVAAPAAGGAAGGAGEGGESKSKNPQLSFTFDLVSLLEQHRKAKALSLEVEEGASSSSSSSSSSSASPSSAAAMAGGEQKGKEPVRALIVHPLVIGGTDICPELSLATDPAAADGKDAPVLGSGKAAVGKVEAKKGPDAKAGGATAAAAAGGGGAAVGTFEFVPTGNAAAKDVGFSIEPMTGSVPKCGRIDVQVSFDYDKYLAKQRTGGESVSAADLVGQWVLANYTLTLKGGLQAVSPNVPSSSQAGALALNGGTGHVAIPAVAPQTIDVTLRVYVDNIVL